MSPSIFFRGQIPLRSEGQCGAQVAAVVELIAVAEKRGAFRPIAPTNLRYRDPFFSAAKLFKVHNKLNKCTVEMSRYLCSFVFDATKIELDGKCTCAVIGILIYSFCIRVYSKGKF